MPTNLKSPNLPKSNHPQWSKHHKLSPHSQPTPKTMTQIAQNPQLSPCSNPSLELNLYQEPILPPSTRSIAQAPAVSPTIAIKPIIPLLSLGNLHSPLMNFNLVAKSDPKNKRQSWLVPKGPMSTSVQINHLKGKQHSSPAQISSSINLTHYMPNPLP